MSQSLDKIFQGDTPTPQRVRVGGVDVANCTCQQNVVDTPGGDEKVAAAPVTDTVTYDGHDWFLAGLTPAQTNTLQPGTYVWVIEIDCPSETPPVRKEIHLKLDVTAQGIS